MGWDEAELAALKVRVAQFDLDEPGDAVPFSLKLRRETGWSATFAARVIGEYKRFVVLAVAARHKVSPSKAVDLVWHQHLTDTRRYWDEFCSQVLGRPLHHEPSRGGAGEAEVLAAQYRATLDAYVRLFGEAPPRDIWPAQPAAPARLKRFRARGVATAAVAAAAPLTLVGCAIVDSASPGGVQGPQFIAVYAVLAISAAILAGLLVRRPVAAGPEPQMGEFTLGLYELAYLAGGRARLFTTALFKLIQEGRLLIPRPVKRGARRAAARKALSPGAPLPPDASPIEQTIVEAARKGRLVGSEVIAAPAADLKRRLEAAGLLPGKTAKAGRSWIALVLLGPILALGLVRLYFGLANHRPAGFLIIATIGVAFALISLAASAEARTYWGKRLLAEARAAKPEPKRRALVPDDPDPVLSFALWGVNAVVAGELADFRHIALAYGVGGDAARASGSNGGGGCSGGGSGGCGGGGCGGCGG